MQEHSIDTPLAELTLRRYERPYELDRRELVRKLCLSLGLLQPGDSRDVIVDMLFVLLQARKQNQMMTADEIRKRTEDIRAEQNLSLQGVAPSNIRRQLKRLRDALLVEKIKTKYRITEFMPLEAIFSEKIESFMLPSIISRIREYLKATDEAFSE